MGSSNEKVASSKVLIFVIIGIIIGGIIGVGAMYLKSTTDTIELRLQIQEHINTIHSLETNLDELTGLNVDLENSNEELRNSSIEKERQIDDLETRRAALIVGYDERIADLNDALSNIYQNYYIAQDGYGDAAAKSLYDLGYRGCIMLFNGSSNTAEDFLSKFEGLGGTILSGNGIGLGGVLSLEDLTISLGDANFFAQAYTTDTTYNRWDWTPREGFNETNVILVTFGLDDDFDISYYNGISYPYLASLPRIDLLNRYPPDH